ncbi:MAG: hypothetical protein IKY71_09600 [Bacteroidaceae bacterium]|nr:hypothetical protein [Bacteroidaceae bacterium]
MKRIIYFISLVFAFAVLGAKAQNVVLNAEIDTFQMLIGEQATIRLELSVDSGFRVRMPQHEKEIIPGIELLEKKSSTSTLNGGLRNVYTDEYLITSFDSTLYTIPPFEVFVNDSLYLSNPLALAVYTVPIDTANLQNICGPKGVREVELTWEEYRDSVHLGYLLIFFLVVLAWVIIRLVKNKPIIRIVKIKPKEPSHVVALGKIDEIKNDATLRLDGKSKEFYTKLTDTLRTYMHDRYGFNATEMTTGEIMECLRKIETDGNLEEVKEILEVADLVKFAKMTPPANENDRNMANAIEYVNVTKNVGEENLQPTERRVVNKRSVVEKRILIVSVIAIVVIVVAVAALLTSDLYNLFS